MSAFASPQFAAFPVPAFQYVEQTWFALRDVVAAYSWRPPTPPPSTPPTPIGDELADSWFR